MGHARVLVGVLSLLLAATALPAAADPWKDESGKGRWKGEHSCEYKQEYHSGGCKAERKWGKQFSSSTPTPRPET